ncbi:LysR family transcriptional regulator, partial [Cloacibacillus evryensis]
MNIREEEYVLAIWKYRNIKSAADELLISPPGLSMFLSGLEKRLGVKLFHRVGKHLSATDIGMEYISHAQKITEQKREFDAQLSDYKNEVTGTISVGLHPRRTTYMIPRAVKTLTNRY